MAAEHAHAVQTFVEEAQLFLRAVCPLVEAMEVDKEYGEGSGSETRQQHTRQDLGFGSQQY
eukprot:1103258-Rhodomonas_salina.1